MAGFAGSRSSINSYQFYAAKAIMQRMGSSESAASQAAFSLTYAAPLEAKTPLQLLHNQLNTNANKVMYERVSYTDLNLQRDAGSQTDLYEERSNVDSFQSRNIIP